jgi:hypothetical protein
VRTNLSGDIDPAASSFRVRRVPFGFVDDRIFPVTFPVSCGQAKGNRVTVVLKKKERYPTWYKLEDDRKSSEWAASATRCAMLCNGCAAVTATSTGETKAADKESPESSIMDMMKKMYDEGDDNMKVTQCFGRHCFTIRG